MAPGAFDYCSERPERIQNVLNSLDRYNPDSITTLGEYVNAQCEGKFFDQYANLALLKLYQFNPHLLAADTATNILVMALTSFPSPSFSLCLSLLPPSSVPFGSQSQIPTTEFTESIQKLTRLSTLLESAQYETFWSVLGSDDVYADLYAEVAGFEDLIRIRIAGEVGKAYREIELEELSAWLDLRGEQLTKFVQTACGWTVSDKKIKIPSNMENEAKSEVKGEHVTAASFGRVIRRGFEAPA